MKLHRLLVDVSLIVLALSIIIGLAWREFAWRQSIESRIAAVENHIPDPAKMVPLRAVERGRKR